MKKYIITWSVGEQDNYEEVEVSDIYEAEGLAQQRWEKANKAYVQYAVIGEATDKLREECL